MSIKNATWVALAIITLGELYSPELGKGAALGTLIGVIYACGNLESRLNDMRSRVQALEDAEQRKA